LAKAMSSRARVSLTFHAVAVLELGDLRELRLRNDVRGGVLAKQRRGTGIQALDAVVNSGNRGRPAVQLVDPGDDVLDELVSSARARAAPGRLFRSCSAAAASAAEARQPSASTASVWSFQVLRAK